MNENTSGIVETVDQETIMGDIEVKEPGIHDEGKEIPFPEYRAPDEEEEDPKWPEDSNLQSLIYKLPDDKLPIIYDDIYNITFMGLQKLHPFDSEKWGRIVDILSNDGCKAFQKLRSMVCKPREATDDILAVVHTQDYLDSLKWSSKVARVTEVLPIAILPNFVVQSKLLRKLRTQTGGTVLAAYAAYRRGWSINIGGGFHHCYSTDGGGFCAYADITMAIKMLMEKVDLDRIMIVDLDAHQGNGHERDFMGNEKVYIMDVYNRSIYPQDEYAKGAIKKKCPIVPGLKTDPYMEVVTYNYQKALEEFKPQFILYNAGTDILEGDPLGMLNISEEGVIQRDEFVFKLAREQQIPIAMVTSGGYQRSTANVIARSIINLHLHDLIPR